MTLFLFAGALLASPAQAVERVLRVIAPARTTANQAVKVTVRASTDAGGNEQIGFLHVEYSRDGGKTWKGLCFEQNQGPSAVRALSVTAGEAGTPILVRARAAYRGGQAGDVDFTGAPIKWSETWGEWSEPPARNISIEVDR